MYTLSTLHSDSLTIVRRQVDKVVKEVSCPDIIADYNQHKGGVDLADQAVCYYVGRQRNGGREYFGECMIMQAQMPL